MYNLKRALGYSVLLYIATFVVGLVLGFLSGQDMSSMDVVSEVFWYVGMGTSVALTIVFTRHYLRGKELATTMNAGLYFGLTAVGFSVLFDLILFTAGNVAGANVNLMEYYSDPRFWIIVLLVIASAAFTGWWQGRNSR